MMDYSLIVGVSYNDPHVSQQNNEHEDEEKKEEEDDDSMSWLDYLSQETGPKMGPLGFGQPANIQIPSAKVHHSSFNVGIVDFLSRYGIAKATAHFFKSMIWKDETLSTVPAPYYAKRFTDYLPTIFCECDSTCTTLSSSSSLCSLSVSSTSSSTNYNLPSPPSSPSPISLSTSRKSSTPIPLNSSTPTSTSFPLLNGTIPTRDRSPAQVSSSPMKIVVTGTDNNQNSDNGQIHQIA